MRIFLFVITFIFTSSVTAQTLGETRLASLQAALNEYNQATINLDFGTVMGFFPPKVLTDIAELNGVTVEDLISQSVANSEAVRESLTIHRSDISTEDIGFNIQSRTGYPPEVYTFLPYRADIDFGNGRIIRTGHYLALQIESNWYFFDLFEAGNVTSLRNAYPLFNQVTLPSGGTMVPAT